MEYYEKYCLQCEHGKLKIYNEPCRSCLMTPGFSFPNFKENQRKIKTETRFN